MNTNSQRILSAILAGGLLAWWGPSVAVAESHPDFSGHWLVESVSTTGGDRNGDGGFRRGGGFGGGFGGFGSGGGGFGGGGFGRGDRGDRGDRRGRGDRQGRGAAEGLSRFERGQHVEIVQTEKELTEVVAPDAGGRVVHFPLDGSDGYTSGPDGNALKTKTAWDGAALVTESKATEGGRFKSREVRSLGAGGTTATIQLTIEGPSGKRTTTVTLTKQEG